jgi:asparagine synthase (glutamine-hydrolysing)
MVDVMYRRGPDDRGVFVRPQQAMGMRRLSIIDLDTGAQPISNEDGTVHVVMNGELYSYPEVRRELVAAGHRFTTHSDTEVLVHGYEEWGLEGLLSRLNGMFAFALYDEPNARTLLVRDRLGIKPLLFAERDGLFVFGSTMSAVAESGVIPMEPDGTGIRLYLHNQFIPGEHTAIAGVRKLPPASFMEIQGGRVAPPVSYWSLPEAEDHTRTMEDWKRELEGLLDDAVRTHMVSDVEVGIFLSGGVDSTIALGLMSRHADRPVRAFSIGFGGHIFDESEFAREAARRFGAEFHHTEFTAAHVEELALDVIAGLEEPLGDPACIPTFYLAREAAKDLKVVLSGEGADELFAGYNYHRHFHSPWARFAEWVRHNLLRRLDPRDRTYSSPVTAYPYAMRPETIEALIPGLPGARGEQVTTELESAWAGGAKGSPLSRALHVDTRGWLPDDLLVKLDRMTMAHGLEARVPFLDYRVVELAMRMPSWAKRKRKRDKVVLRSTFENLIGERIATRDKHGFSLPLAQWFRGDLRPLVEGILGQTAQAATPWIDEAEVRSLLDGHMRGQADFSRQLWILLVLIRWFERMQSSAQ